MQRVSLVVNERIVEPEFGADSGWQSADGKPIARDGGKGSEGAEEHRMGLDRLADALAAIPGAAAVQENASVARFTSLRAGGPADWFVVAETVTALRKAVVLAWRSGCECRVLGGGSNVLVSDAGIRGLVILNRARDVGFTGEGVKAESGASLSTLARKCVAQGLGGLEWAVGIPGSVGGAVVGNAGAWGGDVASALIRAQVLGQDGAVRTWLPERFAYGYRTSILKAPSSASGRQEVILEAEFHLKRRDRKDLEDRVEEIVSQRKASQPAGASCGSVFKNPPGDYAGRLIEAAGLKGHRRGSAEISRKHANFILNRGGATAADIKALIDLARSSVSARFGTELELEIELVGEW
jgi:UDP-N-acetylmuramate dehydrogenase